MRVSCTFPRYSELFIESRRFSLPPPAFGTPIGGDAIRISLRCLVSDYISELSGGVVCVILSIAVLVQIRLVADGHIHAMIAYAYRAIRARAVIKTGIRLKYTYTYSFLHNCLVLSGIVHPNLKQANCPVYKLAT